MELKEYIPVSFDRSADVDSIADTLWRNCQKQVTVDFPTPATDQKWRLTNQGWVGHISISRDCSVSLPPKVGLKNLFRMLDTAYKYEFKVNPGIVATESLPDYCDELASILAKRILDRSRRGFYRSYVPKSEELAFVRSRINLNRHLLHPWHPRLDCQFKEFTGDITDNQILVWTLYLILRGGICSERIRPLVRQAYREVASIAQLRKFNAGKCLSRLYNRLNEDYRPMHALCRFFIDHTIPDHGVGDHGMLPFLVRMPVLYEMFVAEWLKKRGLPGLKIRPHHRISLGQNNEVEYNIDLLLEDAVTGKVVCLLDTKYKNADAPARDDLNQVVACAVAYKCAHGVLVYPARLSNSYDIQYPGIRVRALAFPIDGDLDAGGEFFCKSLMRGI